MHTQTVEDPNVSDVSYGARSVFRLVDASFTISTRSLLSPINVSIPSRTITGLIGHNGSGKSTLLKLLSRQISASKGVVHFQDRALNMWGGREFARKVGYLPQQTPPTSGMLAKELVALGRYPWHGAMGAFRRQDKEKTDEAIELTGISSLANRTVDTLSGGEKQRVWLAMLIAQDAECLLLDEPTSALDIAHQIEVLSLVKRLSVAKGLSVVAVLHDVNMANRFCENIIALHSGKVIFEGEASDVMRADQLEMIYGLPMQVLDHPSHGWRIAVAQ